VSMMKTERVEFVPEGTIIPCPNCRTCSMVLTDSELDAVKSGQHMIDICQVCGKEVMVHELKELL
jgi:ssDNA-binding Zn-finger/Zn-ribbon topoisomerase 1